MIYYEKYILCSVRALVHLKWGNKMLFYGSLSNFLFDEVNKKNLSFLIFIQLNTCEHTGFLKEREDLILHFYIYYAL